MSLLNCCSCYHCTTPDPRSLTLLPQSQSTDSYIHFCNRNNCWWLPSNKLTWQWNIPMFNRKYIFKGSIFHCYVSLPEGILLNLLSYLSCLKQMCGVKILRQFSCKSGRLFFSSPKKYISFNKAPSHDVLRGEKKRNDWNTETKWAPTSYNWGYKP